MAGLTLAQAEQHLNEWLSADSAVAKGQAYSLGGRTLTRRCEGDPREHPLLAADGEAARARRRESARRSGAARMNAQTQLNWIDRAVSYFSPQRAARRMRTRMFMAIAGSFVGASYTRRSLSNWFVSPASADEDTVADLETLRARSRDMVRNAPLATGAVNTVVMNVVGTGLSLLPRPDGEALGMTEEQADEWTPLVEREFRLWAAG